MPQSLPKQSRHLKQCQKCFKSDSKDTPLQTCSKCKRAHYCSRECQIQDWKDHKPICASNRETRAEMKSDEALNNDTLATIGLSLADAENKLKKWVQYYKSVIGSAVVHALKLQTTPEACLTHLLSLTLTPNFTAANPPIRDKEIWTAFRVENIQVISFADCMALKPQLKTMFDEIAAKTKNARKQNFNAIGFGIVLITIPCIYTTRFLPYGIEGPPEKLVSWDPQWQENLKMVIERGIAI